MWQAIFLRQHKVCWSIFYLVEGISGIFKVTHTNVNLSFKIVIFFQIFDKLTLVLNV
jgi:hypothetical protein